MSQAASEALATAHANARANTRHPPARRDPAEAGSTPFAALIDRADTGSDGEAGSRADRFRVANSPAELPRNTARNHATPRVGDRRHADRTQADQYSADRKTADRQDVSEARDRRNAAGVDTRKYVGSVENDGAKPAENSDAPTEAKSAKDSDSAGAKDTVATSVDPSGGDAAAPAASENAGILAEASNATVIAAAIDPAAAGSIAAESTADASGADKPGLAAPADAARAALAETDSAASAQVEVDLAIDGVPTQSADEPAAQDTDGGIATNLNTTETVAGRLAGGAADHVLLQARTTTIDNVGETTPDGNIKPADGETKPAADAGKPHATAADTASAAGKASDAPPAPANAANGNPAPGTPGHVAHNPMHTPQAQHASPVAVAHAAEASAVSRAQPVPIEGLAVEIAARAHAGKNSFEIRLDPPELGRIEVRLDVDRTGQVTSRLVVDRIDTLELLRRDAAGLERALQDAGLKTSDNGLQFSLRDQSLNQQAFRENRDNAEVIVRDDAAPIETFHRGYRSLAGSRGGVDIRV